MNMSDQIEAYLNGELSAAARADFEEKMAASPEFRQAVADQKLLLAALRRKRVLGKIAVAEGINFRRKLLKIGSLLLLLAIGVGLFFYLKKGEKAANPPVFEQKMPDSTALKLCR